MKRSMFTCLFVTLGAIVMFWGTAAAPAIAQTLTVRFAWYMPPNTATARQGNTVAKEIETLSHGKIHVQT